MLCLTYALFVFASEHSSSVVFGRNFQDVCSGDECSVNDSPSSSFDSDVTSANRNNLPIHVIITFTSAQHKSDLQSKFALTVSSLFQHSSRPVMLYIIGDAASQLIAKNILVEQVTEPNKYKVRFCL